jgi:cytochrome c-type biogenesis protein CcmF
MGLVLAAVLGFAPYSRWMKSFFWRSVWVKRLSLIILLIISLNMIVLYGLLNWPLMMSLGMLLVMWIVSQTLLSLRPRMGLRVWGMHLAHLGFAVLILGIAISTHYSIEDDVVLGEGQSHTMGQYEFTLDNLLTVQGPNYQSIQAILSVKDKGNFIGLMKPEKRFYNQGKMPIAQIALNSNLSRDLYVALAEPLKHDQWIVRIQVKPWIRLIWLGAIMMTLGGLVTLNRAHAPFEKGGRPVLGSGDLSR